jgi:hypothetical protein
VASLTIRAAAWLKSSRLRVVFFFEAFFFGVFFFGIENRIPKKGLFASPLISILRVHALDYGFNLLSDSSHFLEIIGADDLHSGQPPKLLDNETQGAVKQNEQPENLLFVRAGKLRFSQRCLQSGT